jgi:hypothetical protein
VIAVVVRVDEQLDALRRLLLQSFDTRLGGVRELRVHGDGAIRRDEIADGAAAAAENPHVPAHLLELGDRRRRRLRLRETKP